jgi:hypothetical protein
MWSLPRTWSVLAFPGALAAAALTLQPRTTLHQVRPAVCEGGFRAEPGGGPYGVFLFCDDAHATTIGAVCAHATDCPKENWGPSSRFWQDASWCRNVRTYAWHPDGDCLLVGTGETDGSAKVYLLDLPRKSAAVIFRSDGPLPEGASGVIIDLAGVDPREHTFMVKVAHFGTDGTEIDPVIRILSLPACGEAPGGPDARPPRAAGTS